MSADILLLTSFLKVHGKPSARRFAAHSFCQCMIHAVQHHDDRIGGFRDRPYQITMFAPRPMLHMTFSADRPLSEALDGITADYKNVHDIS